MKHIAITLICLIAILVYTVASYIYIDGFHDEMTVKISNVQNNEYSDKDVLLVVTSFEKHKKALRIMVNEELVDETDKLLTELEYDARYNNIQNAETHCALILNNIKEIKRTSHTLY